MVGIGQGRVTDNLAVIANKIDGAFTVSDEDSIAMVYELLDTEGLYLGASSALNVAAAAQLAQRLGKGSLILVPAIDHFIILFIGSRVVTVLCDGAYRYQSRLFSKKWLQSKNLESAIPTELIKYAVLD